jgi:hypothetical protein
LYPNHYFPTTTATTGRITNDVVTTNYPPATNQQMLSPYTSVVTIHETNTIRPQQQQPLTPHRSFEYNHSNLVSSPSVTTIAPQPPIPMETKPFRTPVSAYPYQPRPSPPHWHRTGANTMNQSIGYASEPTPDYMQRDFHYPYRSNLIERTVERKQEPRVLHYYTGYDYFSTIDPSDAALTRHHSPPTGPGTAIRYDVYPSYRQQGDYIKSTM